VRVKLWYRGFTVEITGECDVAMRALDVVVRLISRWPPESKQ